MCFFFVGVFVSLYLDLCISLHVYVQCPGCFPESLARLQGADQRAQKDARAFPWSRLRELGQSFGEGLARMFVVVEKG